MTIEEAAKSLNENLRERFQLGTFTVGQDQRDTIYVYEHKRSTRFKGPFTHEGFRIVRTYIGKMRPCAIKEA